MWFFAFVIIAGLMILGYLVGPQLMGWPQVPNLTLLPEDNATFYLDQLGLEHQIFTVETDNPLASGVVIGQDPLPGRFIRPGGTVRLSIGIFVGEPQAAPAPTDTPATLAATPPENTAEPPDGTSPTPDAPVSNVDVELAFASDRSGQP